MRAAVMRSFSSPLALETVDDPVCGENGVVVRVRATGVCRSDWHAWMGHDPSVSLPHVPGHERCGEVAAVGASVRGWSVGASVRPGELVAKTIGLEEASAELESMGRFAQEGVTVVVP